jgi:hypothetical protein
MVFMSGYGSQVTVDNRDLAGDWYYARLGRWRRDVIRGSLSFKRDSAASAAVVNTRPCYPAGLGGLLISGTFPIASTTRFAYADETNYRILRSQEATGGMNLTEELLSCGVSPLVRSRPAPRLRIPRTIGISLAALACFIASATALQAFPVKYTVTGTFGAAVGAGRLLKLNEQKMINALGIAGSYSGGLIEFSRCQEGAMIKRLHLGKAGEGGVSAALVKEALGHSTIRTTSDLYLHLFPDDKANKAAVLGQFMNVNERNLAPVHSMQVAGLK